ncbi:CHAT domain-containing protein [Actinoplanes auranticolor]|uniref:CHAT domain-containing protein n=1 Tax=Actinoplanes auranticolor TaxID=47988 RepID=A0A919S8L4_9ACTN|nr:CHAT domain-containing protein [Actinoplanes auranticolor]GIM67021.1 hypothetical protein Aau02nite_25560 [Actinoplanes auranticolor]
MGRRPPRTSYGYLAPPEARVRGWKCVNQECGTGDEPAPRSWPYPCRRCGHPADATFAEPWAHEARIHRIRHELTGPDPYRRETAELEQHVWAYKDAWWRDDSAAADRAWLAYRRARPPRWQGTDAWWIVSSTLSEMVSLAARSGDTGRAITELLECYPFVDTRDVDDDNTRRTIARAFVTMCIGVLEQDTSIDHPGEAELHAAMDDVAGRIEGVLMDHHHRGFQRLAELRALHRSRTTLARTRRSAVTAVDGLPPVSWPLVSPPRTVADPREVVDLLRREPRTALPLVDSVIDAAQTHEHTGPLDDLVRQLAAAATWPALTHLLRSRLHVITGDLTAAVEELELAAAETGPLARRLRPQILATHGLLLARIRPDRLDDGIALGRAGRAAGRDRWRRVTPADTGLARLLLWRALRSGGLPADRSRDVREAVRLSSRRCRPWHPHGPDDRLVHREALAARGALTGRGDDKRSQRAWRRSVGAAPSVVAGARTAVAWAEWAAGTRIPEFAAEAYGHLVTLAARDAVARDGEVARQRVLTSAQEYAEEAGYWLARTGRYREAVLALETGRAVGLSEVLGGRGFSYEDITSQTGDGALVYLAAAKAGGYALVVAASHDPQFLDLPKLNRATVAGIVGRVQPEAEPSTGLARLAGGRDLAVSGEAGTDPMADGLRTLWHNGVMDLLLHSARGRIVTFIPVGLLNLVPLHAAGEPGAPGDRYAEWRHTGHFSAIRYAPNARALRRCRDTVRESAAREQTLLAVDVPAGHGVRPGGYLHHVTRETTEVTRRWTGSASAPVHACTWAEFSAAADRHTVWHLACHGSAEPASILDSRLYFADRVVTLEELRRTLSPGRRRLAVLSACRTNLVGSAAPNEVVGLPSALIQLGFAGVIATAWAVDDLACTYLMTAFYQRWCRDGEEPAVALNQAQQWLRRATRFDLEALLPGVEPAGGPDACPYVDPRYWAAFAYTGA